MGIVVGFSSFLVLILLLVDWPVLSFFSGASLNTRRYRFCYDIHSSARSAAKQDDKGNGGGWFKNYKFGDITKSIAKGASSKVNELTGKDEYEFGDLSRWLDAKAKSAVNELTEKEGDYEFGDLSRWIDSKVKDKVNEYTGEEEYSFGDVSKEIVRRVARGDYTLADLAILCKILVSFGAGLSPVASFLPVKLLVELLNYSLLQDIGGRVAGAVSLELDKRMKEAVTGDAEYELGDLTKRSLLQFIGKDEYKFGDISRKVVELVEDKGESNDTPRSTEPVVAFGSLDAGTNGDDCNSGIEVTSESEGHTGLDPRILAELEQWDVVREAQKAKEAKLNKGNPDASM